MPSLSIVFTHSGMAKSICVGACEWPKIAKSGSFTMVVYLRNVLLISANEQIESSRLRKGSSWWFGRTRFPDNAEDDRLDNASCEIAPILSDVPMKIWYGGQGKRKIVWVSFYVLSNGASEATQGPLPEIRVLFRSSFVFRATFLQDLAMSTLNPGSWYSCPKWRHKSHKHRVEPSCLHRAWLAA